MMPPAVGDPVTVGTGTRGVVVTVVGHRLGRITTSDWRHWWWGQPGHDDGDPIHPTTPERLTVGVPTLTLVAA